MIGLIREKLKELKENFPQNPEFRSWMQQSDQWSWVYSILRIRGEKVHKTAVVNMIQGSISEDLTLSAYILADHFRTVYQDMIGYIGMSTDLEQKMVLRWAKMILDLDPSVPDSSVFRQNRNVIYEWDLIPEPEEKVPELFSQLLKEYKLAGFDEEDPLKRAVKLHLEINRLYPFGEDTTFMSMIVLMFSLLELGYPLPQLSFDDREYNRMMADYIGNGDPEPFQDILERSIYNRLEAVVSLARQANEI
ncbi:MAG: Fic family protein [Firmicutes bacterium]|nr:Fic family protein [Bacillota bacterium]MBR0481289.1 Fic family protein [Bacillota bacterium]